MNLRREAHDVDSLAGRKFGNYEILRELGRGGMGVVYKAHEQSLQRTVALKVLAPHLKADQTYVKRFVREARIAAQLNHPNIVQIYAVGEGGGTPYIAMQYVRGETVAERIRRGGRLKVDEALAIVQQTAEALAEAHRRNIVHRDIKPQNIMIDDAGHVKVMDFGLARLGQAASALSQGKTHLGTPLYMAPEQARGAQVDARSDVYSLGVTLYEILAGNPPFQADTPAALLYQILHEPFPDIRTLNDSVPPAVSSVIARMTARNPDERYSSAKSLCADLRALAEGPAAGSAVGAASRRGRWLLVCLGSALVVCLVLAGWRLLGGGLPSPSTTYSGAEEMADEEISLSELSTSESSPIETEWREDGDEAQLILPGSVRMEFVAISPGSFLMGGPAGEKGRLGDETQHRVTLNRKFWMGKHEVTQTQWESVMGENPSLFKGDKNLPVEQVSWRDCQLFLRKLNASGLKGRRRFQLPSEAEWEYACRAGTTTLFYFGDEADRLGEHAWFSGNSGSRTHPVGQRIPNKWGLCDMHGNVAEWCGDWYGPYPSASVTDPTGSGPSKSRVVRGGSCAGNQGGCRSGARDNIVPGLRSCFAGFRLVRQT